MGLKIPHAEMAWRIGVHLALFMILDMSLKEISSLHLFIVNLPQSDAMSVCDLSRPEIERQRCAMSNRCVLRSVRAW